MAFLKITTPRNRLMSCGGFLIRRNFVLTAAHCAGSSIMVILGAHNIQKKEDTWQKLKVIKQFPHPKYDDLTIRHDIMLLKVIISFSPVSTSCSLSFLPQVPIALRYPQPASGLQPHQVTPTGCSSNGKQFALSSRFPPTTPSPLSSTDNPSCPSQLKEKANLTLAVGTLPLTPHFNSILPGRMCRVAGWGRRQVNGTGSDTLQEVKQRLMDPQACRQYRDFDHNLQLCVGNPRKTKTAFKGDSGGPLLCAGVAQGIVSYGQLDAKPPAVFTRISYYRPWINEVLKQN
ncbi:chymase-like isoform X2 [Lontra canadensis]|nr:chymase-like isoform X2 [Lontra canadensis]